MIYAYKYLEPHPIEQFHENITYFFERLFVLNPPTFDTNELLNPDFTTLVRNSPVTLFRRLEAITHSYHYALDNDERIIVQNAFRSNNDIEAICQCISLPYKYSDLPAGIREEIKDFFDPLWTGYPQNMQVEASFGTVKAHFDAFLNYTHQQALVCPFCGITTLQPSGGAYRDAYDHFIPKGLYPFNSVNFHNLVPACHICNSPAKHDTDVPFDAAGGRRYMTYPFTGKTPHIVEAHIVCRTDYELSSDTSLGKTKSMWSIVLTESGNTTPEMDGWDAVYNIRQRYKDHIGQYENEWWRDIFKKYKRQRWVSFEDFKTDMLDDWDNFTTTPMAILRKAYYSHLFSIPDVEMLFNQTV
ncbi:hypothetical protein GO755_30695 [Spirosoma sp. HMF4905]|uniref:HNH endonuclease n=1 Tax=Spirosoma arboris TaxID=2682092 RepID=A0A7K1SKV7_9BACT|nr:HNH endonuclease [Spirosoma arboris]MVM34440.1 hypothetical protein [Spirosoma arboris]